MDIFTTKVAQRDFLCAKIANKDRIYISSAAPFGRVMTLNFAPRLKRAFIRWPGLFGAGWVDGHSRGCSGTQMAEEARP